MLRKSIDRLALVGSPQTHGLVCGGRHQQQMAKDACVWVIGPESRRADWTGVPLEHTNGSPSRRIPQTRCPVIGDRQEVLAIGSEDGIAHRPGMLVEVVDLLAAARLP